MHYYVKAENTSGLSGPSNSTSMCRSTSSFAKAAPDVPTAFALKGNYPNPFNPTTEIHFDLPEAVHVSLVVYDVMGREVARLLDGPVEAGFQQVTWEASRFPSGFYLYRMVAGDFVETRRMILMK